MRQPVSPVSRRDVLKILSLGAGAWILTACGRRDAIQATQQIAQRTPSPPAPTIAATHVQQTAPTPFPTELPEIPGLRSLPVDFEAGRLTPIDAFYVQSYNGVAKPDPLTWRLSLNGAFENPMELSMADIRARPSVEVMRTLECIGNPVGGNLIGNATWKGISLRALLEDAGLMPEAKFLSFYSEDEYETSIPVALGLDERSLLVYEMNGEPLPREHGSPLRVLLPGVYGQKQPKWIVSIRASERYKKGTWEQKGWSDEATIQINSRVETPSLRQTLPAGISFYITGIAMADTSGVTGVDVSIDDGQTWQAAELLPGPNTGVWTLWYWKWEKPEPGKYVVLARAMDGNGVVQMASGTFGVLDNVFPNGSSLMHRVPITVS